MSYCSCCCYCCCGYCLLLNVLLPCPNGQQIDADNLLASCHVSFNVLVCVRMGVCHATIICIDTLIYTICTCMCVSQCIALPAREIHHRLFVQIAFCIYEMTPNRRAQNVSPYILIISVFVIIVVKFPAIFCCG